MLSAQQADRLYWSGFWQHWSPRCLAILQMHECDLCMPWAVFWKALEQTLERTVEVREYATNFADLQQQLGGTPELLHLLYLNLEMWLENTNSFSV